MGTAGVFQAIALLSGALESKKSRRSDAFSALEEEGAGGERGAPEGLASAAPARIDTISVAFASVHVPSITPS